MNKASNTVEVIVAWCAVLTSLAVAAFLWYRAPTANLVYTWTPQAIALGILFLIRARPAAIAGAALVFTGYLAGFHSWVFGMKHPDSMAWLIYTFSLPGGLVGGVVATIWLRKRDGWSVAAVGLTTAAWVMAGITIGLVFWMYYA